jgi:hypothetical protein
MSTAIEHRVRTFWEKCGADPRTGVAAEEIAAFEVRHGLSLPQSVAAFYRAVNGTVELDSEVFAAWPLSEVGTVRDVVAPYRGVPDYGLICELLADAGDYFAFGDCMIWSQVLAVRLRPEPASTEVIWISGAAYAIVAPTFEEFWEEYLRDPVPVLWARHADIETLAG